MITPYWIAFTYPELINPFLPKWWGNTSAIAKKAYGGCPLNNTSSERRPLSVHLIINAANNIKAASLAVLALGESVIPKALSVAKVGLCELAIFAH